MSYFNYLMLLASIPDYKADLDKEIIVEPESERDSLLKDIG